MLIAFMILLFLLIALLLYIILAPFYIEINTRTGLYRVRFQRIASVRLIIDEGILIETNILGFKKRSAPVFHRQDKPEPGTGVKVNRKSRSMPVQKLVNVLRSFKITTCDVLINTGDMELNGLLYPVFNWLSWQSGRNVAISFTGGTEINLQVKNSIARMGRAYLKA